MTKRTAWILAAVVVISGAIGGYFLLKPPAPTTTKIEVGFNTWVGYGPLYIAKEKGFFEQEGLQVDLQRMEGTGERRAALAADRLQAMGSTIDDLIVGGSQQVPGKMVLALDESDGADGILVSENIKTIQDLKGKRIAVQPGFVNHFFLLYVLDQNKIKPSEVTTVPLEPDKAAAAFVGRDVDVAVTWEPHLSSVKKARPDGRVLLTTKDYPGIVVDIVVFRDDFIDKNPKAIHGFVRAWYKAVQFLKDNPAEGQGIIAKALGLKTEEVAEMLSGVRLFGPKENSQYYDNKTSPNVYGIAGTAAKLWVQAAFIKESPNVEKLIDARFYTDGLK